VMDGRRVVSLTAEPGPSGRRASEGDRSAVDEVLGGGRAAIDLRAEDDHSAGCHVDVYEVPEPRRRPHRRRAAVYDCGDPGRVGGYDVGERPRPRSRVVDLQVGGGRGRAGVVRGRRRPEDVEREGAPPARERGSSARNHDGGHDGDHREGDQPLPPPPTGERSRPQPATPRLTDLLAWAVRADSAPPIPSLARSFLASR
jgi:hypothetical protein